MNKRGKTIEYVVFCMNNRIEHVPLESEPDAIMEVLNGYPDVRLLTEIRL